MLTANQKKDYIDGDGGECPNCLSTSLEGGSVDIGAGSASQEITCNDCGKSWQDVYELVRIEED